MKTFEMKIKIRAECESDAEELINDYSGAETHIEILETKEEEVKIIAQCPHCKFETKSTDLALYRDFQVTCDKCKWCGFWNYEEIEETKVDSLIVSSDNKRDILREKIMKDCEVPK